MIFNIIVVTCIKHESDLFILCNEINKINCLKIILLICFLELPSVKNIVEEGHIMMTQTSILSMNAI